MKKMLLALLLLGSIINAMENGNQNGDQSDEAANFLLSLSAQEPAPTQNATTNSNLVNPSMSMPAQIIFDLTKSYKVTTPDGSELIYAPCAILGNSNFIVPQSRNSQSIAENTQGDVRRAVRAKKPKHAVTIDVSKEDGKLRMADYFNIEEKNGENSYSCKWCPKFKNKTQWAASKHLHRTHVNKIK